MHVFSLGRSMDGWCHRPSRLYLRVHLSSHLLTSALTNMQMPYRTPPSISQISTGVFLSLRQRRRKEGSPSMLVLMIFLGVEQNFFALSSASGLTWYPRYLPVIIAQIPCCGSRTVGLDCERFNPIEPREMEGLQRRGSRLCKLGSTISVSANEAALLWVCPS